jgi:THO complex subunit 2
MAEMDREIAAKQKSEDEVAKKTVEANGDVKMGEEKPDEGPPDEVESTADKTVPGEAETETEIATDSSQVVMAGADVPATNAINGVDDTISSVSAKVDAAEEAWHPVMSSLMNELRPVLADDISTMGIGFYTTFWQLSLYDIQVPTKSYEDEVTRLKQRWIAVRDDRSDPSNSGIQKKEKDKKQLTELQDDLRDELKGHIQVFSQVKARLSKERGGWFKESTSSQDSSALHYALVQYCFLPRLLQSPHDALFAAKLIRTMQSINTPGFRTFAFYDEVFKENRLANVIFTCTSREAENLALFIHEALREFSRWVDDKTMYEKECFGPKRELRAFAEKINEDGSVATFMDFEDFRRLHYKWHRALHGALKGCLNGGEYMHIRNAIIVLKGIHLHFPAVNWIGQSQLASVEALSKNEKREDLKIAAVSLLSRFQNRTESWKLPQDFAVVCICL